MQRSDVGLFVVSESGRDDDTHGNAYCISGNIVTLFALEVNAVSSTLAVA